jgi:predicted nucleic-acid-binding Zn-ribbon protein
MKMDGRQFFELIKNIYTALKCPSCGEVYEIDEIQFMGQFDGLFLIQMTCSKCKLPVSVNFYARENPKELISDLKICDLKSLPKEPISTNEVIDFHSSLKKFDGDIKKLLGK